MANEMLNLVNRSQKPPKSQAHIQSRSKEFPDNVFKEYYEELPEIGSNSLNSDGTARQLRQKKKVKCKLCSSRITKNSFSQHMRNIHLPDETCGSCNKEFPASKILGHRRQCGKIKGEDSSPKIIANSGTNSPGLVVVEARSANEMLLTLSTHMSAGVGDLEAGPGGSEAEPVGSEAGPGGLESETRDSEYILGHSGKLKVNSQTAETMELAEAASGAGPGRSVDATRRLESSAAAAVGLKAAVGISAGIAGSLSTINGSSEIAAGVSETTEEKEEGSAAGINCFQTKIPIKDVVEITIRVESKVYILMVSKRKPFKKAMKKMAARLGKEVGLNLKLFSKIIQKPPKIPIFPIQYTSFPRRVQQLILNIISFPNGKINGCLEATFYSVWLTTNKSTPPCFPTPLLVNYPSSGPAHTPLLS